MGRRAEGLRPAWCCWQAVLLAASILSPGFVLTQAADVEVSVTVVPSQKLAEGQDVTMTPGGEAEFVSCNWYRGSDSSANRIFTYIPSSAAQANGPAFTGRETLGPGCSLQIQNVAMSDNGTYTVIKLTISGINEIGRVQLEVLERVSNITIFSNPEKALENKTTILTCSSAGTDVSYHWSKGNQPLASGGHISLNSNTLTFSSTNRSDSGNYTCYGNNSFSHSSAVFPLNVFYGPDEPVISPPEHDYANGSSLTLSCHADSYLPAQYTWYYNGTELGKDPSLPIPSLSFDQAGNYTCEANNSVTGIVRSIRWEINVLENVSHVDIQGPGETSEGDSVNLTCAARGTQVSYAWFRDNQALKDGGHIHLLGPSHENLMLSPVNRSDAGSYTCQGVNSVSKDTSKTLTLDVLYGPDVPIISPPGRDYAEGSNVNLSCRADSYPVPRYAWLFNETQELGNISWILISDLSFEKAGTYICNATNPRTNASRAAAQEVRVVVAGPGLFSGLSAGAIVGIVIGCLVGVALIVAVLYVACKGSPFGPGRH